MPNMLRIDTNKLLWGSGRHPEPTLGGELVVLQVIGRRLNLTCREHERVVEQCTIPFLDGVEALQQKRQALRMEMVDHFERFRLKSAVVLMAVVMIFEACAGAIFQEAEQELGLGVRPSFQAGEDFAPMCNCPRCRWRATRST